MMVADFDPIAIQLGPISVHWYALAYLAGFLLGWGYIAKLVKTQNLAMNREQLDRFLNWAIAGVLLGGRLGYVVFYNPLYYSMHPLEILYVWQGGMSFHGGLIGIISTTLIFARREKINPLTLCDLVAAAGPIGLFLGRLTNFINGELFGRHTTMPWGVVFPHAPDMLPRHPSQLYEAASEGLLLFIILFILVRYAHMLKKPGFVGGFFLSSYALFRFLCEFFREPDMQLGFLYAGATMGQLLCLPMFLVGVIVIFYTRRKNAC